MKKIIASLLLIILILPIVTGCETKRKELKYIGDEGTITFNVKEKSDIKISLNKKNFRTTREQGILIGKDFKIGIEFSDDFKYFFDGNFEKLKDARKDNNDYKEVTYSGIDGIQYFYDGYNRYNVILMIKDSKKYYVVLSIYGNQDTEKSAKEAIYSEEVLDVLNNITNLKLSKKQKS